MTRSDLLPIRCLGVREVRCEDIRQKPLYPMELAFLFNHGHLGEKFIKPLHEAAMLVEPEVRRAGFAVPAVTHRNDDPKRQ